MKIELYPHQIFSFDFHQITAEASRQESLHTSNRGELEVAKRIFDLLNEAIGVYARTNEWLYEACARFAEEYAYEYFERIRLTGEQVVKYQNQLISLNEKVENLLAELCAKGKSTVSDSIDLKKASDFIGQIKFEKLNSGEEKRIMQLYEETKDHESLQLNLTLEAIADLYEIGFPRIMFVLRRGLKLAANQSPKASDDKLLAPADYLDWIKTNLEESHILISYFAGEKPRTFYKFARNIASHHRSLVLDWENHLVRLVDRESSLDVPLYEFQQRYRYLTYLVDYGVRGILYHFSDIERGDISFSVCKAYEKIFPENLPNRAPSLIKPYE